MLRGALSVLSARAASNVTTQTASKFIIGNLRKSLQPIPSTNFSTLIQNNRIVIKSGLSSMMTPLRNDFLQPKILSQDQIRTVTKFGIKSARRKTVKSVIRRFYRLNCGLWIRTIAGKRKKYWKKSARRRRRHIQHVFCNATQSYMLDKMVSRYWRKPKYYIKNIYEPYEWRENFIHTRTKPWRPEGVDYE